MPGEPERGEVARLGGRGRIRPSHEPMALARRRASEGDVWCRRRESNPHEMRVNPREFAAPSPHCERIVKTSRPLCATDRGPSEPGW
jgi:hypothetical protein